MSRENRWERWCTRLAVSAALHDNRGALAVTAAVRSAWSGSTRTTADRLPTISVQGGSTSTVSVDGPATVRADVSGPAGPHQVTVRLTAALGPVSITLL